MGEKRCCCISPGCPIFEDDFNRRNSTNLGSGWEEVHADSEIRSNQLWVPPTGIVIGTKQHPSGAADLGKTGEVRATALNLQEGKKYQSHINVIVTNGGIVSLSGILECGAYNVATISVGGHSNSDLSYEPGQNAIMYLCRSDNGLYFTVPDVGTGEVWACHEEDNGGRKAGLGNIGAGNIEFDDYYFGETWWTDPDCPLCYCECWDGAKYHCMPKTLTLTYSASGLCSCEDGQTVQLEHVPLSEPPRWEGDLTMDLFDCMGNPIVHHFSLTCEEASGKCGSAAGNPQWLLCLSIGDAQPTCGEHWPNYETWNCDICAVPGYSHSCGTCPVEQTCDPFYLKFGPFICTLTDETCIYYIEVTE